MGNPDRMGADDLVHVRYRRGIDTADDLDKFALVGLKVRLLRCNGLADEVQHGIISHLTCGIIPMSLRVCQELSRMSDAR